MSLLSRHLNLQDRVFIRTARYDYVGDLAALDSDWLVLRNAYWVGNSGNWNTATTTGELKTIGRYKADCPLFINKKGMLELMRWGQYKLDENGNKYWSQFALPGQHVVEDFAGLVTADDMFQADMELQDPRKDILYGRQDIGEPLKSPPTNPYEQLVGKATFFRTVRYDYIGEVVASDPDEGFLIRRAFWIADSGEWETAAQKGQIDDGEPYPDDSEVLITNKGLLEVFPWGNEIPRKSSNS